MDPLIVKYTECISEHYLQLIHFQFILLVKIYFCILNKSYNHFVYDTESLVLWVSSFGHMKFKKGHHGLLNSRKQAFYTCFL